MKDKHDTDNRQHQPVRPNDRAAEKARELAGTHQTRRVTEAQLAQIRDQSLQRDIMTGEVRSIDEQARTVELAFSSEVEVERWFGIEVLDHGDGAMRTERLENGAAVLVDHNWRDQVGVVESITIGTDRVGRAKVRFGRGTRASEIWQDVVDGIRRHVSVGYAIFRVEVEERPGMPDMVRVTDWEPHEISIVAVPADTSVGVGRSREPAPAEPGQQGGNTVGNGKRSRQSSGSDMKEKILRDGSGNLVRAKVDDDDNIVQVLEMIERAGEAQDSARREGVRAEQKRAADIMEMGRTYGNTDLAARYVADGKTPEEFQRALLDAMNEGSGSRDGSGGQRGSGQRNGTRSGSGGAGAGSSTGGAGGGTRSLSDNSPGQFGDGSGEIGMNDGEMRQYSLMRAIRAMANPQDSRAREEAAFEIECSEEAQRKFQKEARGILIPEDVLGSRAFNAGGAPSNPSGSQSGSNVVDNVLMTGSFIEMLRNRTTIMRLARSMSGLVGNVSIPKQTNGATAYWVGEGEDASEGSPTIGQINMTPKTVAAYTDITRRLMMQSTPDAEGIVRGDLVAALAQAIDLAGYYGSGTENQPLGIVNTSGINAVEFATAGKPTYAELVQMESEIAADNADVNSMAYVLNARMRGHAKTTSKFQNGTDAGTIWETGNTINGYTAEVTNQIQSGDVLHGNFADLVIGLWGGLDLTVDPYSLSKSGGTRLVVFQDVDFVARRVESFCVGRAASTA
ncbi:HK97 family phage major capsid protein [Kushneria sinocarnis]|uniref:HK97 family phage major capsid protein n=1 Tax=Kushneria sinocarnis TaxID=595502 RepID=A0A420WVK6_9GAMM|nr:phage major capsid protein [Kushneria sinocarnis]RKR02598.1 HK97 family phage major capsid protein [Kushneria sinocarnis]